MNESWKRRIIQITSGTEVVDLFALDNMGQTWGLYSHSGWQKLPELPEEKTIKEDETKQG